MDNRTILTPRGAARYLNNPERVPWDNFFFEKYCSILYVTSFIDASFTQCCIQISKDNVEQNTEVLHNHFLHDLNHHRLQLVSLETLTRAFKNYFLLTVDTFNHFNPQILNLQIKFIFDKKIVFFVILPMPKCKFTDKKSEVFLFY